jgi:hypothetical protein
VIRQRRWWPTVGLATITVLLATGLFPAHALYWDTSPLGSVVTDTHYLCGSKDLPEKGIQGDVPMADQISGRAKKGYNCGLALDGFTSLGQQGRPNNNANMAWAGHCAYISGAGGAPIVPQEKPSPPNGAGVAVVSVTDSGKPTYVATLRSPGTLTTSETINAVTTPSGRSILVVGQYGNDLISKPKPMDIYDVSNPDCTKFKLLTTFYWPANIHNLTITQDGKYVFATLPLQAADISGLWANPRQPVKYLGNIQNAMGGPPIAIGPVASVTGALPPSIRGLTHPADASHEAWPSADDKTLYVGGQTPTYEVFTILDISQWLERKPDGSPVGGPRIISQQSGRGHSVRLANIGGKPYVLHSEESVFGAAYGCIPQQAGPFAGPAQPWLTDISDPTHPVTVSQFGLAINSLANCPEQLSARENDSVHYHDVDNPNNTTFVMASMWNAGLRVFDVRDPKHPTEVAYFNPADIDPSASTQLDHAWGHVRYIAKTGQIWFATANGGFFVVHIEGQVRNYLNLDAKNVKMGLPALHLPAHEAGRPGTLGLQFVRPAGGYVDISPYYCTLGGALPHSW